MQWKRFHQRRHGPLKRWKLTDIDLAAIYRWDDYTAARHDILRFTHTSTAPWTVVRANDRRRARLETIRVVLSSIDYESRDGTLVGTPYPKIVGKGSELFYSG
jgi:polyphosphate kinase 2 (PPK2 family)